MGQSDAYEEQQEAAQRAAFVSTIDLDIRFAAHSLSPAEQEVINGLRWEFRRMANRIVNSVPAGREQALALTHLEEAMFFAVAGIARS